MKEKKLFISLPMSGRDEDEILSIRDYIYKIMKPLGYELMETYYREDAPEDAGRLWYLGRSIQDLGLADLVIFAPGWRLAKGCLSEHYICDRYNIPHVYWAETTEAIVKTMLELEEEDDKK